MPSGRARYASNASALGDGLAEAAPAALIPVTHRLLRARYDEVYVGGRKPILDRRQQAAERERGRRLQARFSRRTLEVRASSSSWPCESDPTTSLPSQRGMASPSSIGRCTDSPVAGSSSSSSRAEASPLSTSRPIPRSREGRSSATIRAPSHSFRAPSSSASVMRSPKGLRGEAAPLGASNHGLGKTPQVSGGYASDVGLVWRIGRRVLVGRRFADILSSREGVGPDVAQRPGAVAHEAGGVSENCRGRGNCGEAHQRPFQRGKVFDDGAVDALRSASCSRLGRVAAATRARPRASSRGCPGGDGIGRPF